MLFIKTALKNAAFAAHFWKSVKKRLVLSRKMHGKACVVVKMIFPIWAIQSENAARRHVPA